MEAISGRKPVKKIAADHAIHPIQVSQWKRPPQDGGLPRQRRHPVHHDQDRTLVRPVGLRAI
jgi:hypothetical protein